MPTASPTDLWAEWEEIFLEAELLVVSNMPTEQWAEEKLFSVKPELPLSRLHARIIKLVCFVKTLPNISFFHGVSGAASFSILAPRT